MYANVALGGFSSLTGLSLESFFLLLTCGFSISSSSELSSFFGLLSLLDLLDFLRGRSSSESSSLSFLALFISPTVPLSRFVVPLNFSGVHSLTININMKIATTPDTVITIKTVSVNITLFSSTNGVGGEGGGKGTTSDNNRGEGNKQIGKRFIHIL